MQSSAADSPIIPDALLGLPPWQQMLAVLAVALGAAGALRLVGPILLNWGTEDEGQSLPAMLFDALAIHAYLTLVLGAAYISLQLMELPVFGFYLMATILSLLVIVWGWAAVRFGRRTIAYMSDDAPGSDVAPVLGNLWTLMVVLVTGFVVFDVWRINLTPLLASASILGIVIGLAAQDAIANLVGGLALFADNTYKPGDFVVLDTGEKGTVVDIGLRATTIVTLDQVEVTVPNAVLNSTHVINESAPRRRKRIRVPVGVDYGVDLDRVEEVLLDVMDREDEIIAAPRPRIHFREFGDSALILELRGFISHPAREAAARNALNRRVHRRLAEEGIRIPYPQRTLSFEDGNDGEAFLEEHASSDEGLSPRGPQESDEA